MNRNTTSDETEESLTQVDVDDLTEYELREVIPACDFVVVGYDSSYSDADVSTKRVNDPEHSTNTFRHLRGPITGTEADGDRAIGFGKGDIRTDKSSGRIGSVLWVRYPAPEPDKTRYTVRFRSLAGNWSAPGDRDDPDYVDELTQSTVDKYSYDGLEMPPKEARRIEDFPTRPTKDGEDVRTRTKTVVDVPVTLTIADADTTDVDEVVERARSTHSSSLSSWYEPLQYRDELPDVHSEANEGPSTGPSGMGRTQYVRVNTRYVIEDVEVETESV